jgi:peptide/nickel transport system permease protein
MARFFIVYLTKRIVLLVVLLAIISFLIFSLLYIAPGNAAEILLGTQPSTPAALKAIEIKYHLGDPFFEQYLIWIRGAVNLNFGTSIQTGQPVTSLLLARLPVTLFLGIYSFVASVCLGVPLGVLAAVKKHGWVDRSIVSSSVVGVSTPAFVSGIVLLYIFALRLGWFPIYGAGSGFAGRLGHLTLPAAAMTFGVTALILKLTRAAMIEVLDTDYVTFARSRGAGALRILIRYGLRNAIAPVVTAGGLVLAIVLTGTILVEQTFSLPGVASLLVSSVQAKDVPVVQGFTLLAAALVLVANLLADLAHLALDPRVRPGRHAR